MKPFKKIYCLGGGHSKFIGRGNPAFIWKGHEDYGKKKNPGLEEHLRNALDQCLNLTKVEPELIDKVYISNFLGECFARQGHLGSLLVKVEPKLSGKPITRVEAACASGAAAITSCVDSLLAGADLALAIGVELETNVKAKEGVDYMNRAGHYQDDGALDPFVFPFMFAKRAKFYKQVFGASNKDIAKVVFKAYRNAAKNPKAQMKTFPMDLNRASQESKENYTFLENADLKPHIKFFDCTTFTDGASACILASEEGLKKLGKSVSDCTEILSYGHSVAALGAKTDPTEMTNMKSAAKKAYDFADLDPGQVQVAEVHDCFSISELLMYEAIGIAERGQGKNLIRNGHTEIDGKCPVNTGGGLLGFGHPIGATGIKQVVEIFRQMKGLCGDYQMPNVPGIGISANLGGDDRTGIVILQQNCQ